MRHRDMDESGAPPVIDEIREHLPPQSIRDMMEGTGKSEYEDERILSDKLHDLYILYSKLEENLENQYVQSEDYLTLLAEQIPYAEEISCSVFL